MKLLNGQKWVKREPGKLHYTTVYDDGDGYYSFLLLKNGCGEIHEWMTCQECVDALQGLGFVPYSIALRDGLIAGPIDFSDSEGMLEYD